MLQTLYGFWKNSLKSTPATSTSRNAVAGSLSPSLLRNGFARVPGSGIHLVDGERIVTLYGQWMPTQLPETLEAAALAPHVVNDGKVHVNDPIQRASAQSIAQPALAANPALETHVQGLVSAMAAFSAPAIGSAALGETIGKPWFTPMITVDGTS
jgi:hypothetical protein